MNHVRIVDYEERWPGEFAVIAGVLREGLGELALRIDHIGSTAVPGLGSKDIIDLQVTVASFTPLEPLTAAFAEIGYRLRDVPDVDHRPPGDTRPAKEWEKRYAREPEGARRTHCHIRVDGRANQRYALLFRDYLRGHRPAATGYEAAKRALAQLHPGDIDAYWAVKDPICDIIMAGAEAWAAATNWTAGPWDA